MVNKTTYKEGWLSGVCKSHPAAKKMKTEKEGKGGGRKRKKKIGWGKAKPCKERSKKEGGGKETQEKTCELQCGKRYMTRPKEKKETGGGIPTRFVGGPTGGKRKSKKTHAKLRFFFRQKRSRRRGFQWQKKEKNKKGTRETNQGREKRQKGKGRKGSCRG